MKKRFRNTINFSGIRIYFRYSTQLIEVQWEIQFAHCAHFNKVRKRNAKLKLASKMPEKKSQYTLLLCSAFDKTFSVLHERMRFFLQQRISNSFSQAKPPGFVCIFILYCNISIRVQFDSIRMESARFASFVGNLISQCVSDIHSTRLSNVNRFKYATWESIKWMQIPRQILSDRVIR